AISGCNLGRRMLAMVVIAATVVQEMKSIASPVGRNGNASNPMNLAILHLFVRRGKQQQQQIRRRLPRTFA
ncbi:hypothetical protein BDD12DRAFT_870682, partial [Trichophaea hybrida]